MGINMLVGDKYKIESDSLNITIYRRAKSKQGGGDSWRAEAYFATVKNALKYLVDREVRETGLRDLKTVEEKQDKLYDLIKGLNLPGDPPQVMTKPCDSDLHTLRNAQDDAEGCNMAKDKENYSDENVTVKNDPDVTTTIKELSAKGLSSRAIAEVLQSHGIKVSHMTVARRLQGKLINNKLD